MATTALQAIALGKLKGQWQEEQGIIPGDATTVGSSNRLMLTDAEIGALRGWFEKQGLKSQEESYLPPSTGKYSIIKLDLVTRVNMDSDHTDEEVLHASVPGASGYAVIIELHKDDFTNLQNKFSDQGWFSIDNQQQQGRGDL